MPTAGDDPGVTLINVFTVAPADQQRLIDLLTQTTERFVSRAPGFVSATLHRSIDGRKVTMYSRWRSVEHYQAMRQDGAVQNFLEDALSFATFEPGVYTTERTFGRTDR
jgi:quinol monooxygenase YgiN